jgi:UDP-N-acetylglucosamine transferase subunit ALG13
LTAIALAIRQRNPAAHLLFAVEGDSHGLLEAAQLPYVTFPSPARFNSEDPWVRFIKGPLLGSLAASIVHATDPSLIVFDCLPNPAFIAAAERRNVPFAICVRKFKDMDDYFRGFRPILEKARLILFPHNSNELIVPPEYVDKSYFVGPIVRPLPNIDQARVLQAEVVISGGGGGYPGTVGFYNLALEAFVTCRTSHPELSGVLVTGPLFREWSKLKPVSGIRIIPFDPQITTLFRKAKLVISQAGYNTVAELTSLRVPVISVPAERKFDNQHERARHSAEVHKQFYLWEGSDSDALAGLALRVLEMPFVAANAAMEDSPGAGLAAELLIDFMLSHTKA